MTNRHVEIFITTLVQSNVNFFIIGENNINNQTVCDNLLEKLLKKGNNVNVYEQKTGSWTTKKIRTEPKLEEIFIPSYRLIGEIKASSSITNFQTESKNYEDIKELHTIIKQEAIKLKQDRESFDIFEMLSYAVEICLVVSKGEAIIETIYEIEWELCPLYEHGLFLKHHHLDQSEWFKKVLSHKQVHTLIDFYDLHSVPQHRLPALLKLT
jgi:hypothetical protein